MNVRSPRYPSPYPAMRVIFGVWHRMRGLMAQATTSIGGLSMKYESELYLTFLVSGRYLYVCSRAWRASRALRPEGRHIGGIKKEASTQRPWSRSHHKRKPGPARHLERGSILWSTQPFRMFLGPGVTAALPANSQQKYATLPPRHFSFRGVEGLA